MSKEKIKAKVEMRLPLTEYLQKQGYGKVEDYKKEIERLKEKIETLLNGNSATPFITSSIGDLPLNTDGLLKAVDEITRLNRVQAELQELNFKYYNEAKDLKRECARLKQDLKISRSYVATDIDGNIIDYATTSDDKVYHVKEYINLVKKEAIKEFADFLKQYIKEKNWSVGYMELDNLLKEYGIGE